MTTHAGCPLSDGDVVGGSYVVERVIGTGGMAFVALAAHSEQHHRVAIKILRSENARRTEVIKRFEREQRTLTTLHSEHTLRIYGFGQHAGLPYMLLEYLEGQDLEALLKSDGPLPLERAIEYVLQACHAIAEAHLLGIVHRDLKPANLFLTRRTDGSPCVKVLDFGISKVSRDRDAPDEASLVTKASAVMGSPFYMSPEQMLSSTQVDARSDIWSLAVTLFELLTKSLPFAAETAPGVCQRIMSGEPTPLRKLRPNYPKGLEATIDRCLQRRPDKRFANIADFAVQLGDFAPAHSQYAIKAICALVAPTEPYRIGAPGIAVTVPLPGARTEATGPASTDTTVYLPHGDPSPGGFRLGALLGASAVAFTLGVSLGWVMNLDTDPTRSTAPNRGYGVTAAGATARTSALSTSTPGIAAPGESASGTAPDDTAATPIDLDGTPRSDGNAPATMRTPMPSFRAPGTSTTTAPAGSAVGSTTSASSSTSPPQAPDGIKPAAKKGPAAPNVTF